jgi:acetyl esterase/lipase
MTASEVGLCVVAGLATVAALLWWRMRSARHAQRFVLSLIDDETKDAQLRVLEIVNELTRKIKSVPITQRLATNREALDEAFGETPRNPDALGVRIEEVELCGVQAEWVLGPNSDPNRRMLYLHGGSWISGSRLSHRTLTAALTRRTGLSVLVPEYRLMPENKRRDGIEDCQNAYRWMLDHGPGVAGKPTDVFVAGDSAGGNLALMLTAWIRDKGSRQVDGAVTLSPATDGTIRGRSLRTNLHTDVMLGPAFEPLVRLPSSVRWLATLVTARANPRNPIISPLYGNLADLPPTLVHVSESEMLLDDARNYVRRAQDQGSPIVLQTWPSMVHVWHMFTGILPQADEALGEIEEFIESCSNSQA